VVPLYHGRRAYSHFSSGNLEGKTFKTTCMSSSYNSTQKTCAGNSLTNGHRQVGEGRYSVWDYLCAKFKISKKKSAKLGRQFTDTDVWNTTTSCQNAPASPLVLTSPGIRSHKTHCSMKLHSFRKLVNFWFSSWLGTGIQGAEHPPLRQQPSQQLQACQVQAVH
jgi:hypothetical protein